MEERAWRDFYGQKARVLRWVGIVDLAVISLTVLLFLLAQPLWYLPLVIGSVEFIVFLALLPGYFRALPYRDYLRKDYHVDMDKIVSVIEYALHQDNVAFKKAVEERLREKDEEEGLTVRYQINPEINLLLNIHRQYTSVYVTKRSLKVPRYAPLFYEIDDRLERLHRKATVHRGMKVRPAGR